MVACRLFACVCILVGTPLACALAQELSREQWGAPPVRVSHEDGRWFISGKKHRVILDGSTLAVTVEAGPVNWTMAPSSEKDLLVKSRGDEFYLRLADAGTTDITPYDTGFKTGVKIRLGDFRNNGLRFKGLPLDLTLFLTMCLEGKEEELVFEAVAVEHETLAREFNWPKEIDGREVDYTVLSNVEGVLLPRSWPKPYHPIRKGASDTSIIQSNLIECWSMSWWGFQKGRSAMIVIVETPDDAAYTFSHPAGGPTAIGPSWRAVLGRFAYPRSARMCFFAQGNYVDLCKRYRRHVMDSGHFVSLRQKIARQPVVRELIGSPHLRAHILRNVKQGSARYDIQDPEKNYHLTTFDERAQQLHQLKANGFDRLCVTLAGWPYLGYDRQHPDGLPPAPKAGGWEGMKRFFDTCRELGYACWLHDQYRDYYLDAPSYDPQFAVHDEDVVRPPTAFPGTRFKDWKEGYIPLMDHWDGGAMGYLNARLMLGHLLKNYRLILDHGIRPQGSLMDVFGYVPPDEDFNPEHPHTRADCMKYRAACFRWARNNLGVVGTEAGSDWAIPYVDVSSPRGRGEGIAVPLYDLVYHDAIVTQYRSGDELRGLLNGGVPIFTDDSKADTGLIQQMSALHQRVGLLEMTKHEFLDAKYHKERTTFADGTTVTVDWNAGTFEIRPELKPRK